MKTVPMPPFPAPPAFPCIVRHMTGFQCTDMEDLRDALDGIGISVEKKLILFPVSDACNLSMSALSGSQGTHWSLLAYDTPRRRFLYFDSSGDYNVSAALKLAKKLSVRLPSGSVSSGSVSSGSVTSKSVTSGSGGDGKIRAPVAGSGTTTVVVKSLPVKIGQVKTPQQSNGFDCGVFVVLFARALATACAESDSKLMDPANVLRGVGTGQAVAQMRSEIPRWAAATVFKKGKGGNSTSNTKSTGKLALPGQQ